MENRVGDKKLTPQKRAQLLAKVKDVVAEMKEFGIVLTTDARKRALRPRKGADVHMHRVHDLAVKHGVSLKKIPLEGMVNDLDLSEQFEPLEEEFRVGLQLCEDTGTQAGAEAWEAFLAYYGVLSSMAERMPELQAELQSVIDFMALGPRAKPEPPKG